MESEIHQLEETLRCAMLHSDVAALDALIDDALLFVGPGGGLFTKADDLELHRSGVQRLTHAQWREVLVQVHGHTAVSVVMAYLSGTFHGEQFSGVYRYGRTWVYRSDGWRIVGGSVCAIADEDAG